MYPSAPLTEPTRAKERWVAPCFEECDASTALPVGATPTKAHARVFGRGKRDEGRDEALGRRIGAMREIVTAQHLDVAETAPSKRTL